MQINVSANIMATHFWADAPAHREYLAFPHAHEFRFTAYYDVSGADRQLEFHDAKRQLESLVTELPHLVKNPEYGLLPSFGTMSCEHIGIALIGRAIELGLSIPESVFVSEDGNFTAWVSKEDAVGALEGPSVYKYVLGLTKPNEYHMAVTPLSRSLVRDAFSQTFVLRERPKTVTICGSTKFMTQTLEALALMEHRKHICLSVGYFAHAQGIELDEGEKILLDELHKWKIAISDYIFVVNVGGYIGSSTRSEIDFAVEHGIPVEYLETSDGTVIS